jgi:glycosyltransferase involved in cell wall biosynthesis
MSSEMNLDISFLQNNRIAIFHHMFLGKCKGGGEKLVLQMRDHLNADLWLGSFDEENWGEQVKNMDDFTHQLWNGKGKVYYLGKESNIPIWKYIKRQLNFLFNPKVNRLAKDYDIIIFSFGNIAFVPQRVKKVNPKIKTLAYIHTPPRDYTDLFESNLKNKSNWKKTLLRWFQKQILNQFRDSISAVDWRIVNSHNIRDRVKKFIGVRAEEVIWPAVNTQDFRFYGQSDYYHSHARLEDNKRIKLIVEAFSKMPEKKLIITSAGPLKKWLENEIKVKGLTNIIYEGRVSDEKRNWIMGNCIAGIYIPLNEDAGITQCEFMASGKPVIGVAEGGLLETIDDGINGVLIPEDPTVQDLINAVNELTSEKALSMRDACENHSKVYSKEKFFFKLDNRLQRVLWIPSV